MGHGGRGGGRAQLCKGEHAGQEVLQLDRAHSGVLQLEKAVEEGLNARRMELRSLSDARCVYDRLQECIAAAGSQVNVAVPLEIEDHFNQGRYHLAVHGDWERTISTPQSSCKDQSPVAQDGVRRGYQCTQGLLLESAERRGVIWGEVWLAKRRGFKNRGVDHFIFMVRFQKFQCGFKNPEGV